MMLTKFLRKFRGVGKQPLVVVAAGVILVGAVAAAFSWNAPAKKPLIFVSQNPARTLLLGSTSASGGSQVQASTQNLQNPGSVSPSTPVTHPTPPPTPAPSPPVIIKPPIIVEPPVNPPCNYCTPLAGRACPMYVIYPCTPCGGLLHGELLCETQ